MARVIRADNHKMSVACKADEEKRRRSLDCAVCGSAKISKSRLGKKKPMRNAFGVVTGVYGMKEKEKRGDAKWEVGRKEQQGGHSKTLMSWQIVILVK